MPLNTTDPLANPLFQRRKRRLGVTPDVAQTFGNEGMDVGMNQPGSAQNFDSGIFQSRALQNRANDLALGLNYDPQKEISSAQMGINTNFDNSQTKLARIFALDPGGTKSGTAQNRLETLETGRATALSQAERDIYARSGTEQRANVGTLDSLLSSGTQRNIATTQNQNQLKNDSLNRAIAQGNVTGSFVDPQNGQQYTTQQVKQYQDQLRLQESQVTGAYNGQQTLAGTAQATQNTVALGGLANQSTQTQANISQGQQQINLQSAGQSADINLRQKALDLQSEIQRGTLTIDQANQQLNDFVQRGQLSLSGRQVTLAEGAQSADVGIRNRALDLQAEIQRGSLSIDQANQQLNDFVQRTQVANQTAQTQSQLQNDAIQRAVTAGSQTGTYTDPQTGQSFTTQQVTQFNDQLALQKAGLTGQLEGQKTLQGRAQTLNELDAALQRAIQQGNATGTFTDPETGVSQQTLQAEITRGQQELQKSAQNFTESAQVAQLTGVFTDPETGQSLDTLAKTDQAFTQELQKASLTGDLNGVTTLAARSLALQEAELTGQVGDQKTIAQKALDLQGQIQTGQLALQQQAQAFGQNITESELTGLYKKMGNESGAFQASYNTKAGDANFNGRYDLDGNGTIDLSDYTEFAKVANNEPVQTLQAQALQEQKAQNEFAQKVTESGLKGTYQGQQTVIEKQRVFDNSMKESQLFVDAPPITLGMDDWSGALNSKSGDANYRKDLDTNGDGNVNVTDFVDMIGSGRIDIISGSITDPYNTSDPLMFTYKPEGKMSVIAAQLGLEETKLGEATRQFNQQYLAQNSKFLTDATGYLFDGNGVIQSKLMPANAQTVVQGQQYSFSQNGQIIEGIVSGFQNGQIKLTTGELINPTNSYISTPVTTIEGSQFAEQQRQFNAQLDTQIDQFAEQLGFTREQLDKNLASDKDGRMAQVIAAALGAIGNIGASGNLPGFRGGNGTSSSFVPFFTVGSNSTPTKFG